MLGFLWIQKMNQLQETQIRSLLGDLQRFIDSLKKYGKFNLLGVFLALFRMKRVPSWALVELLRFAHCHSVLYRYHDCASGSFVPEYSQIRISVLGYSTSLSKSDYTTDINLAFRSTQFVNDERSEWRK